MADVRDFNKAMRKVLRDLSGFLSVEEQLNFIFNVFVVEKVGRFNVRDTGLKIFLDVLDRVWGGNVFRDFESAFRFDFSNLDEGVFKKLVDSVGLILDLDIIDVLGMVYDYYNNVVSRAGGWRAGEFYTMHEVARLMVMLLDVRSGSEVYDPACGSGRLLLHVWDEVRSKGGHVRLYGQEINERGFLICWVNSVLYGLEIILKLGDTLRSPMFFDDVGLKKFDYVIATPPWVQRGDGWVFDDDVWGRFVYGRPPDGNWDWGWMQHIVASLKPGGRAVVLMDTGVLTRGSRDGGKFLSERKIRERFVEEELIDGIVLLPDGIFYTAVAQPSLIVIDKNKTRKGKIFFINAQDVYEDEYLLHYISYDVVKRIYEVYRGRREVDGFSREVDIEEIRRDEYNLNPSLYVRKKLADVKSLGEVKELFREVSKIDEGIEKINKELRGILDKFFGEI